MTDEELLTECRQYTDDCTVERTVNADGKHDVQLRGMIRGKPVQMSVLYDPDAADAHITTEMLMPQMARIFGQFGTGFLSLDTGAVNRPGPDSAA